MIAILILVPSRADAQGAYPHERPLDPPMVAATVYRALGIDPHLTELPGPAGPRSA